MREAIGNSWLFSVVIVLLIVIIMVLAGSSTYTKAYKVKNKIIEVIETNGTWDNSGVSEVEAYLNKVGYKKTNGNSCSVSGVNNSHYNYCVKLEDETETVSNGDICKTCVQNKDRNQCVQCRQALLNSSKKYKITAYMYLDLPIIGSMIKIPVTGETKNLNNWTDDAWK